jgi:flagellar basal-body rod modification protein FlgD
MNPVGEVQDLYTKLGLRGESDAAQQSGNEQKMDFLLLMTEQIKHQNPLNPLEGQDFLAQLAQFSVVDELTKLNSAFEQLSSSVVSDQSLQAAGLIGHQAQVAGDRGSLSADAPLEGAVELAATTGELRVNFYDESGQFMRQLNLGAQPAGQVSFRWDGTRDNGEWAGAGAYRIEALAETAEGTVAAPTLVNARVDSISLGDGGGLVLNLAGVGPVAYADVKAIK